MHVAAAVGTAPAPRPGWTLTSHGGRFGVYAGHADAVDLCLFDDFGRERQLPLSRHELGMWSADVPGIRPGQRYGVRVHGRWEPWFGHRHNPAKLLLDPYARAVDGAVTWRPEVYGHRVSADLLGDPDVVDTRDSAPFVPRGVVVSEDFDWEGDERLELDPARRVIYEVHVKSFTQTMPGVPEALRGTFAGLASEAAIGYLLDLGVTTVELLPIQFFASEPQLVRRGLTNYWGYNTLGFFAPHPAYAAAGDPQGALDEFKAMVKTLHDAGLEVVLDVVYNHSAEQGVDGATLSLRGLDSLDYYRHDSRFHTVDVTGCGNTLDLRNLVPMKLVLDSLRYWVSECHVDGFRFDLAVALARGRDDNYDPDHAFLMALRADPVLGQVLLIAEPWDVGFNGWRTGQFPAPFAEWNDRFRDGVRSFWLGDVARSRAHQPGHGIRDLAARFAGSDDTFGQPGRSPGASVNFVAAHDGFTLADLTAYDVKHNVDNLEGNRDGSNDNRSWNHGVEGPGGPSVERARRRSMRNLLGTLLVSAGVPMINAGDEFGRSQGGNNNPYCQDNEISWFDWDWQPWQQDLHDTTRFLIGLRQRFPVLRQRCFFPGRLDEDGRSVLRWYAPSGDLMVESQWSDGFTRTALAFLSGSPDIGDGCVVAFHGGHQDTFYLLPRDPGAAGYELLWDSAWERPEEPVAAAPPGAAISVTGPSMQVFRVVPERRDPGADPAV